MWMLGANGCCIACSNTIKEAAMCRVVFADLERRAAHSVGRPSYTNIASCFASKMVFSTVCSILQHSTACSLALAFDCHAWRAILTPPAYLRGASNLLPLWREADQPMCCHSWLCSIWKFVFALLCGESDWMMLVIERVRSDNACRNPDRRHQRARRRGARHRRARKSNLLQPRYCHNS